MSKLDEIFKGLSEQNSVTEVVEETPIQETQNTEPENVEEIESSEGESEVEVETVESEGQRQDDSDSWDTEAPVEVVSSDSKESAFDFGEISKEFGFEEIKTKDEFISKLKNEFTTLKSKDFEVSKVLEDVPATLAEAVMIAKEGGDYLEYLNIGKVDYSIYSDKDLVANSIANYFLDEEGKVNEDELNDYVESLPEKQVQIEADKIRKQLDFNKLNVKNKILSDATKKKELRLKEITEAVNKTESISGYKLNPYHKQKMITEFEKDNVIKALFYTDGKFDASKAIDTYFKVSNWDKIENFRKNKIRNETKKMIVDEMSNIDIDTRDRTPAPSAKVHPMDNWIGSLKKTK